MGSDHVKPPPAVPARLRELPGANELRVWAMTVADPPLALAELRAFLSEDEEARLERLRLPRDRVRAIVARGALRVILGSLLDRHPAGLTFRYGPKGKPDLVRVPRDPDLSFSVSHSGDWVLVAVAAGQRVGADIEAIRPVPGYGRIADRYFAPRECSDLGAVPEARRLDAFFCCWTRKEAYVKAHGGGISHGFHRFAVNVDTDETAAILEVEGSADAAAGWSAWSGVPAAGYAAAVVVESADVEVTAGLWLGSSGLRPWIPGCGDRTSASELHG